MRGVEQEWRAKLDTLVASDERPDWLVKVLASRDTTITNMREITALSGGKDSSAMALAQAYFEPRTREYIITPTGDELPEMVEHWDKLAGMLGAPLTAIGEQTLMGLCVAQKAIPNHRQRWCTRILKLEPYYRWLGTLGAVISNVGLRADEESRPGMLFPDAGDIVMNFPMRRWGWVIDDVLAFLDFLGVVVPDRTDCAVCFWQKLGEWYNLWLFHPDRYSRGETIEAFVTASRGTQYTFRSPQRDSWPASLRDLRGEFERGRVPTRSLAIMDRRRQVGACRVCTL